MNYYTVYRTTNLVNQKYYIGKHITDDINDGYLGSGTILNTAINKYGKNNFKKEILFLLLDLETMNQKEKYGQPGKQNGLYNRSHSEDSLNKMRETIGDSRKGGKHPGAKSVILNGVTYPSRVECMAALGISRRKLYNILGEI